MPQFIPLASGESDAPKHAAQADADCGNPSNKIRPPANKTENHFLRRLINS